MSFITVRKEKALHPVKKFKQPIADIVTPSVEYALTRNYNNLYVLVKCFKENCEMYKTELIFGNILIFILSCCIDYDEFLLKAYLDSDQLFDNHKYTVCFNINKSPDINFIKHLLQNSTCIYYYDSLYNTKIKVGYNDEDIHSSIIKFGTCILKNESYEGNITITEMSDRDFFMFDSSLIMFDYDNIYAVFDEIPNDLKIKYKLDKIDDSSYAKYLSGDDYYAMLYDKLYYISTDKTISEYVNSEFVNVNICEKQLRLNMCVRPTRYNQNFLDHIKIFDIEIKQHNVLYKYEVYKQNATFIIVINNSRECKSSFVYKGNIFTFMHKKDIIVDARKIIEIFKDNSCLFTHCKNITCYIIMNNKNISFDGIDKALSECKDYIKVHDIFKCQYSYKYNDPKVNIAIMDFVVVNNEYITCNAYKNSILLSSFIDTVNVLLKINNVDSKLNVIEDVQRDPPTRGKLLTIDNLFLSTHTNLTDDEANFLLKFMNIFFE